MRMSPVASFVALAVFAVGPVACSSETETVENEETPGAPGEEDNNDVQVEVSQPELGPRAACGTYCTRTSYGSIACNLNGGSGRTSYTCKPLYGSSYNTGCVTNRGASYCLPYF